MPVSAERRAMHFTWHLSAITINRLHLIMTIITPPMQTSLLDLGPHRVPSLWLKITQITVNSSISRPLQSTISQLLRSHPLKARESANLPRTHRVHHLLNDVGLVEKRTPLQTLLQVQGHLQALLFPVPALQAGLSTAIMSSTLLCIKHRVLDVRLEARHLRPPTKVRHLMPGGSFGPMTQTKNHPSRHHPFQIVVEVELSTRRATLAASCVHGQYCSASKYVN